MGQLKQAVTDGVWEDGGDGSPCGAMTWYDGDYWSALLQTAAEAIKASEEYDGEDVPFWKHLRPEDEDVPF